MRRRKCCKCRREDSVNGSAGTGTKLSRIPVRQGLRLEFLSETIQYKRLADGIWFTVPRKVKDPLECRNSRFTGLCKRLSILLATIKEVKFDL